MPRIRTLKPEHKQHRKVGLLTDRQYRLWVGMITEADDEGRLVADPAQLRVLIFAYQPRTTVAHVVDGLEALAAVGLLRLYRVGEVSYAEFCSWKDHQRVQHPAASKYPSNQHSDTPHEDSGALMSVHGGSRIKEGIKDQGREGDQAVPSGNGHVAKVITEALDRSARLGAAPRLRSPEFWQAEARAANGTVDLAAEILKAEAWLVANPGRAPHKDLPRFVHNWLSRAKERV